MLGVVSVTLNSAAVLSVVNRKCKNNIMGIIE